jgi:hypothetical protein
MCVSRSGYQAVRFNCCTSQEVPKTDSFNVYEKVVSDLEIDGIAFSKAAVDAAKAYDSHREALEKFEKYKQAQAKRRADLENVFNPQELAAFNLGLREKAAILKKVPEMQSAYLYGTSEVPELILDPRKSINDIRAVRLILLYEWVTQVDIRMLTRCRPTLNAESVSSALTFVLFPMGQNITISQLRLS